MPAAAAAAAAAASARPLATAVTVTNTIVADNTGGDCSGTITVLGNNLDGDTSCGASLSGVNPILGSLQGNGGPTFTHALDSASPAIQRRGGILLLASGPAWRRAARGLL